MSLIDLILDLPSFLFDWWLMSGDMCPECGGYLYPIPSRGKENILKCKACEKLWMKREKLLLPVKTSQQN